MSVTHALKAASFAVEPTYDITQSIITTVTMAAIVAAETLFMPSATKLSTVIREKDMMIIPQIMYPKLMKRRRLPFLSDHMPPISVAAVAVIALAATMTEMATELKRLSERGIVRSMNTLKYMFSTIHATCPKNPKMISEVQSLAPSFAPSAPVFFIKHHLYPV